MNIICYVTKVVLCLFLILCQDFGTECQGKEIKSINEGYEIWGPTVSNDQKKLAFVVWKDIAVDPNAVYPNVIPSKLFDTWLYILDLESYQPKLVPVSCGYIEAWYGMSWDPNDNYLLATVVKIDLYDPLAWSVWKISTVDTHREIVSTCIKGDICQRPLHNPRANTAIFRTAKTENLILVDLKSKSGRVIDKDISHPGFTYNNSGSKIYYCKKNGIWCAEEASGMKNKVLDVNACTLDVSPDSKNIAYLIDGNEEAQYKYSLFVYGVDTKATKEISTDAGIIFQWSKDGNHLLYSENPNDERIVKAYTLSSNTSFKIKKGSYPVSVNNGQGVIFIHDDKLWHYDFVTKKSKRIFSCDDIEAQASGKYDGGEGSPERPFEIAEPNQLIELSQHPEDWGFCFILTADIDLCGHTFTTAVIAPDTDISNEYDFDGVPFSGTFDGNGHKILNLKIDTQADPNDYLGLFGEVNEGHICNLGLQNLNICGGDRSNYLGGLVGYNFEGRINNCYATGSISGNDESENIGGLVGYNLSGCISYCYTMGKVSGQDSLGGLVGGAYFGILNKCYSTSTVRGIGIAWGLGGLIGTNLQGSVSECYATGNLKGDGILGGLVGSNQDGNISNCYATGNLNGDDTLGGLVGSNRDGNIGNCYATGNVSGCEDSEWLGGLVGNNKGTIINSYATGSLNGKNDSGWK